MPTAGSAPPSCLVFVSFTSTLCIGFLARSNKFIQAGNHGELLTAECLCKNYISDSNNDNFGSGYFTVMLQLKTATTVQLHQENQVEIVNPQGRGVLNSQPYKT